MKAKVRNPVTLARDRKRVDVRRCLSRPPARPADLAARRPAFPARSAPRWHARTTDRAGMPRPVGGTEPALAFRRRRRSRPPRRDSHQLRALQCRRARGASAATRSRLCAAQACWSRRGPMPPCRLHRSRDRAGARARAPHHAGDAGVFGGRRRAHDLARGARRRHRHGMGVDPRARGGRDQSSMCRRAGGSSVISASDFRRPKTTFRSWSGGVGSSDTRLCFRRSSALAHDAKRLPLLG